MRFFLILVFAFSALGSQVPTPASGVGKGQPPQSKAGKEQQQTSDTGRQRDTATKAPAVARASPGDQATKANRNEGHSQSPSDWWIIGLTFLLVLVGVGQAILFWWQLTLLRSSLTDTKAAAEAARDSAQAAIVGQRAFVFLSTTPTMEANWNEPMTPNSARPLQFANFGRTPARIDSITVHCRRWESGELEALNAQPPGKTSTAYAVWLAGDGALLGTQEVAADVTADDIERADTGDGVIALVGHLNYTDAFGGSREVGFAYYMSGTYYVSMIEVPNGNLNYSK